MIFSQHKGKETQSCINLTTGNKRRNNPLTNNKNNHQSTNNNPEKTEYQGTSKRVSKDCLNYQGSACRQYGRYGSQIYRSLQGERTVRNLDQRNHHPMMRQNTVSNHASFQVLGCLGFVGKVLHLHPNLMLKPLLRNRRLMSFPCVTGSKPLLVSRLVLAFQPWPRSLVVSIICFPFFTVTRNIYGNWQGGIYFS